MNYNSRRKEAKLIVLLAIPNLCLILFRCFSTVFEEIFKKLEISLLRSPPFTIRTQPSPSQQYVQTLSFGRPMASSMSGMVWYLREVRFRRFRTPSTMAL